MDGGIEGFDAVEAGLENRMAPVHEPRPAWLERHAVHHELQGEVVAACRPVVIALTLTTHPSDSAGGPGS